MRRSGEACLAHVTKALLKEVTDRIVERYQPEGWSGRDIPGDLNQISRSVMAGRYPDSKGKATLGDAKGALETARSFFHAAERDLASRGLDL